MASNRRCDMRPQEERFVLPSAIRALVDFVITH
jgi:hypothetical protein